MKRQIPKVGAPLRRLVATAQNGLEVLRFGGLAQGPESSGYHVIERHRTYRLRRYFPEDVPPDAPAALLVPPLMVDADIWDVNVEEGAVGILHRGGIDCWVVDFGSPAEEEGGWQRTLADHVLAVDSALDTVAATTGRAVHLMGYSQGGMFAYQTAAFRYGKDIASIVTFGSPVDPVAGLPLGLPYETVSDLADFVADHVLNRLPITDGMVRIGFQLLDPVKTAKNRLDFLRQLHDREALLPKERQRRFLSRDGWVGYAGPAAADLLRQFIGHNRMMLGGFVIGDQPISLAELTCPILAFVGVFDDIGQPAAVRGIVRAAPHAQVYESQLTSGHFGLVAGSNASRQTWPQVRDWVAWVEGTSPLPATIAPMSDQQDLNRPPTLASRALHVGAVLAEAGVGFGKTVGGAADGALRGSLDLLREASRAVPRLARLGMMHAETRISLGKLLAEQADRAPAGECLLFEDRVHTNAAVDTRIDNVVRGLIAVGIRPAMRVGVVMHTRPSALVTVAALSRLGAVAVLLAPGSDLARGLLESKTRVVVTDPENLAAAIEAGVPVLVLGGGEDRSLRTAAAGVTVPETVTDLEQIDPASVRVPAWYRPNPGKAKELAFILVSGTGEDLLVQHVTNHRWALSAFGTASAADLDHKDTVYCLAPLHHSSGLLVSLGGAVAGGSRIALARSVDPTDFSREVHRYGVTVVTYTWTMLRDILDADQRESGHPYPIRLFIGSGMPAGLWRRTTEHFAPARVLEFYASTEGDVVLANIPGNKRGAQGRPIPGAAKVDLVAYDLDTRRIVVDDAGYARRCGDNEVGMLIGAAPMGADLSAGGLRGMFSADDAWVPTGHLFRRDSGGDYWMMDRAETVIRTPRGPVYATPIANTLDNITAVDMEVVYGAPGRDRVLAIAAVQVRVGFALHASDVTEALRGLAPDQRPDVVYVVDDIPRSASFRPMVRRVAAGWPRRPGPTTWYYDPETESYQVVPAALAADLLPVG